MGADGHIRIYDLKKVKEIVGDNVKFQENLLCNSITYQNVFKTPLGESIPVLTRYWGDNLYYVDLWDIICYHIGSVVDKTTRILYESEIGDFTDEELLTMKAIICRIEDEAVLVSHWEVWT